MNSVEPRSIYVRWSDDGRFVRKWDYKPFDAATEYRAEPEEADFSGYVDTFDTPPPPLPSAEEIAQIRLQLKACEDAAASSLWVGTPILKGLAVQIRFILSLIQKGQSDAE